MIPLAGMEGAIGQLVLLLIIALVGWATKRASDAEKKKKQSAPPPVPPEVEVGPSRPPPVPRRGGPVPTPPGERPPRARPRYPAPAPTTTSTTTTAPSGAPAHLPPIDPHVGHLDPDAFHPSLDAMHLRVRSTVDPTPESTGRVVDASRRRLAGWRKLAAGLPIRPSRKLARAGVLWSEVLGPPRAITGPHRSPVARRRR